MDTERIQLPIDLDALSIDKLRELRRRLTASKMDIESQLSNYKNSKKLPPDPRFKQKDDKWRVKAGWALRNIENDISKVNLELDRRYAGRGKRPTIYKDLAEFFDAVTKNDHKRIKAAATLLNEILTQYYIE